MTNQEKKEKLQSELKNAFNQMNEAANPAKTEGRDLNAEELLAFDKYETEWKEKEAQLNRINNLIEIEKKMDSDEAIEVPKEVKKDLPTDKAELDDLYAKAFWKRMLKQEHNLKDVENKVFWTVNKAQSTTDSAGGYTIPQGFSNMLEVAMAYYGPMLQAGYVFDPGTGGNDYEWPTLNDTSNTGKLLSEAGNATTNANDLTFANVEFKAYKFSSDLLAYSAEIEADSYFNFQQIIADALGERLGRVQNTYFTTGSGSSEPQGVVTAAAVGKIAAGDDVLLRTELVDLMHSVNIAYRNGPKVGWMFNDSTLAAIKKMTFASGDVRPLWVPSMIVGEPATIEGKPYWVNNDMATIAASALSVLFGDFSKFKIRKAGPVRMKTSQDIYIATDQSAIVAFSRYDSHLVDGGGGAIKKLRQLSS